MKRKMILQSAALLLTASANVGYAHSDTTDHSHSTTEKHSEHQHTAKDSHGDHHATASGPTIKLSVNKLEDKGDKKGDKKLVQIKLERIKDDKAVSHENLKEVHTQKVHLLIIDDSLEDYSHIHPKALKEPGLYEFEWDAKKQANYRVWADLHPLDTDAQEYVIADLVTGKEAKSEINRTIVLESTMDGYTFKLSFDSESLVIGKPALGKITITDKVRNPVKDLEPVMGAFAHIVGFFDDKQTVVHIHPMGEEPSKPTDRGGPELQFHIVAEKAGFIKLFAQVSIKGKELFVPFGIVVK